MSNNVIKNIINGIDSYHEAVDIMSNEELWQHCFDGDTHPDDYCVKELKRRFFFYYDESLKLYQNDVNDIITKLKEKFPEINFNNSDKTISKNEQPT